MYLYLITLATMSVRCSPELQEKAGTVRCSICIGAAASSSPERGYADIFVFNDDRFARLDSYQRMKADGGELNAVSTGGNKLVCVILNSERDRYAWSGIDSYSSLSKVRFDIRNDDPASPFMSGSVHTEGGGRYTVDVEPLMSEVVLRSLRCDFSGKAYSGEKLKNVKIYLTNVNASFRILDLDGGSVSESINTAGLKTDDLASMKDPGMMLSGIGGEVGTSAVKPDIRLYCYPNSIYEESLGSRFTRLVIEGGILGKRYYWPININREDFGPVQGTPGVGRNRSYIYDVCLTSTGSGDPDVPVSRTETRVNCCVAAWKDKDNVEEYF